MKNLEKFFIPAPTSTYSNNPVYIFVDFRIKRAGSSNYRGKAFLPPAESCQILNKNIEILNKHE